MCDSRQLAVEWKVSFKPTVGLFAVGFFSSSFFSPLLSFPYFSPPFVLSPSCSALPLQCSSIFLVSNYLLRGAKITFHA